MGPAIGLAIGGALFAAGAPLSVVNFFAIGLGSTIVAGLGIGALTIGSQYLLNSVNRTEPPKPTDGKYNLKQNVPDLCRVYGRVKKGGDYLFLEEYEGVAFHVLCVAAGDMSAYIARWSQPS